MTTSTHPAGSRPTGAQNETEAARSVREMFSRVAPRYDLLNRLLSFSLDRTWRRRAARALAPRLHSPEVYALDLCCGTGDLALELARMGTARVVGVDFAHPMLVRGQKKSYRTGRTVSLAEADALKLPFADETFDVVTAAFGFRNLANYAAGLREIHRVLRQSGEVGILDFALPRKGLFARLYRFYFQRILPSVGSVISGVHGPYSYLPASVEHFPDSDEFVGWMEAAGLGAVSYREWTGGAVVFYRGTKP